MSAELYEDSIELLVPVLESGDPGDRYPYPSLRQTGRSTLRTFAAINLENASLKVRVVPELGGRVVSIYDKRFSRELVASKDPELASNNDLAFGFAIGPRLTGMAPVALQFDEAAGALLLAESASFPGVSWHCRISLVDEEALIDIETRLLNRTAGPAPTLGLSTAASPWPFAPGLLVQPLARRSQTLDRRGRRFDGETQVINARQVDEWSARILPTANLGPGAIAANGIAVEIGDTAIRLETSVGRSVTVVLFVEGETVEANVQLYAEQVQDLPFGSVKPTKIAILENGCEIFRHPLEQVEFHSPPVYDFKGSENSVLDPAVRHLAHLSRAVDQFASLNPNGAGEELERALFYNAEDHLLWWARAVAQRMAGEPTGPELENAHFLAPLEPLLRAEAFLSQAQSDSTGPNPLIAPIAEHPEELIEIACQYISHGLLEESTRWIGEALRHADLAMLRYLLAYCLLEGTRMDAEAAAQIGLASRATIPPYPWRDIEWAALQRLSERFADQKLAALVGLRPANLAPGIE